MGRPKTFDVDDALHAAMGAFRAHGYEGTSIGDLEGATAIGDLEGFWGQSRQWWRLPCPG